MACNIDPGRASTSVHPNEPQIDSFSCYSQKYRVDYLNSIIADETTYYFKTYLDTFLPEKLNLFIHIDLLYAQSYKSVLLFRFSPSISFTLFQLKYIPNTIALSIYLSALITLEL